MLKQWMTSEAIRANQPVVRSIRKLTPLTDWLTKESSHWLDCRADVRKHMVWSPVHHYQVNNLQPLIQILFKHEQHHQPFTQMVFTWGRSETVFFLPVYFSLFFFLSYCLPPLFLPYDILFFPFLWHSPHYFSTPVAFTHPLLSYGLHSLFLSCGLHPPPFFSFSVTLPSLLFFYCPSPFSFLWPLLLVDLHWNDGLNIQDTKENHLLISNFFCCFFSSYHTHKQRLSFIFVFTWATVQKI